MTRRVAALPAGSRANFTINRQGAAKTLTVQIAQRKEEQVATIAPAQQQSAPGATGEAMGLGLAAVTPEMRRSYNLDGSVEGVLITRVDPKVQSRIADAHAQGRKSVLLLVSGSNGQRYVAVDIGQT